MVTVCTCVLVLVLLLLRTSLEDKPNSPNDVVDTPPSDTTRQKPRPPISPPVYYNPPFNAQDPPLYSKAGTRLVTLNELAAHGSINGTLRPYWLTILGRIYDVDKGETHYGPKGGYSFFTGCDGSKGFVTGDFTDEGLTDDVSELSPLQLLDLEDWQKFYDKDYTFLGKLIARYYDKNGNPTKEFYKYQKRLVEGHERKSEREALEREFPPCNSRFTPSDGGIVYCSTKR